VIKKEFLIIKNVSRDDMTAAHRVRLKMMEIMPNNVGGFGYVEKSALLLFETSRWHCKSGYRR